MKLNLPCILLLGLTACAGRQAEIIEVNRAGDSSLACQAIELELSQIQSNIRRLIPESDKTGKNVALGVAGAFFLVPWFFMDLSSAEKQEIEAYRQRYDVLQRLALKKCCQFSMAS